MNVLAAAVESTMKTRKDLTDNDMATANAHLTDNDTSTETTEDAAGTATAATGNELTDQASGQI